MSQTNMIKLWCIGCHINQVQLIRIDDSFRSRSHFTSTFTCFMWDITFVGIEKLTLNLAFTNSFLKIQSLLREAMKNLVCFWHFPKGGWHNYPPSPRVVEPKREMFSNKNRPKCRLLGVVTQPADNESGTAAPLGTPRNCFGSNSFQAQQDLVAPDPSCEFNGNIK